MRHCCRNCHFLSRYARSEGHGTISYTWTKGERKNLSIPDGWAAECFQGIWSSGINPSINDNLKEVILEDRRNKCFFIEVNQGMSYDAAMALHRLRNNNAQLRRSYLYTQIALGIAAISLAANLIYNVIKDYVLK